MQRLQKPLEGFQSREINVRSWRKAGNGDPERWIFKRQLDNSTQRETPRKAFTQPTVILHLKSPLNVDWDKTDLGLKNMSQI